MNILVLGGSITGGGGVNGNKYLTWTNYIKQNLTVQQKNAIDSQYFMHCTERFVSQNHEPNIQYSEIHTR